MCTVVALSFDTSEFDVEHARMSWNVFLSLTSFLMYCSFRILHSRNKKILSIIAFCLWVVFLPNTFYMITDFKYISHCTFELFSAANIDNPKYLRSWLYVFGISFPVFTGISFGTAALIDFRDRILHKQKFLVRETVVLILIALCGYAITIGRFARVNSWDIIHWNELITKIQPYFSREGFVYSVLYGSFSWLCYMLASLFILLHKGSGREQR